MHALQKLTDEITERLLHVTRILLIISSKTALKWALFSEFWNVSLIDKIAYSWPKVSCGNSRFHLQYNIYKNQSCDGGNNPHICCDE